MTVKQEKLEKYNSPLSISIDTFVLMQTQITVKHGWHDRLADAYYEALEILKMSGVTHIDTRNLEDFS